MCYMWQSSESCEFLLNLISTTSQQIFHTYNNQNLYGMLGQSKQQKKHIYMVYASLKYNSRQDKMCVTCVLINVCLYAYGLNFQQMVHMKEWDAYEIYSI